MAELVVEYPDTLLKATGKSREVIEREMRFQLAVRMFQVGEFSLGQAASMAGMNKLKFADELGKIGVAVINLDDEQIAVELNAIRGHHRR
jgi:predicted HTH domain antitoxin